MNSKNSSAIALVVAAILVTGTMVVAIPTSAMAAPAFWEKYKVLIKGGDGGSGGDSGDGGVAFGGDSGNGGNGGSRGSRWRRWSRT